MELIDIIFKISGLQNKRFGYEVSIGDDLNFGLEERQYMNEQQWVIYCKMREQNRIHSLPYLLWEAFPDRKVAYSDKIKKVLIRGGNHFYRYILMLNLLKLGAIDCNSNLGVRDYFSLQMHENHRFCDSCIEEHTKKKEISYEYYLTHKYNCNNKFIHWQGEIPLGFFHIDIGSWNNKCLPLFYWLADKIEEKHGPLDKVLLQQILNGWRLEGAAFTDLIARYLLYADLKWIHSIYAPPRFWEATAMSTINLVPSRTNDQDYFPAIFDNEHYISFKEDFSDLQSVLKKVTEADYNRITNNCLDLYREWIKPGRYRVPDRLLNYITEVIFNV